jgi:hypothetical protein
MIARGRKRRGQWFWRFRKDGPPAVVERLEDQRWHIFVSNVDIGSCSSREVAEQLVDKLLLAERGRR